MSKLWKLGLVLFACLSWAAASHAVTTLTLDNCDLEGCRGADLTLSVDAQDDGSYLVTYTINTDALNTANDKFTGLTQLGFLAIKDWKTVELLTAPNGIENWSAAVEAVVNSNGSLCAPGDTTDKVCIYAQNEFLDMSGGGNYTWTFKLTGSTVLSTSEWHFSGQWSNDVGLANGNIISAGAAAVPEPSAALLFAVGALTRGARCDARCAMRRPNAPARPRRSGARARRS